jgi:hypothetical protein
VNRTPGVRRELIAWATTGKTLGAGADPGITVTTYEDLLVKSELDLPASELERAQLADAENYGTLHQGNADRLLADAGYQRTGEWRESGAQWSATVEAMPSVPALGDDGG